MEAVGKTESADVFLAGQENIEPELEERRVKKTGRVFGKDGIDFSHGVVEIVRIVTGGVDKLAGILQEAGMTDVGG